MEEDKTAQPTLGTWDRLPTEETERKPKVTFEINIPMTVKFLEDKPREFEGENGAYYVFDVEHTGEHKVIMTSAWSLLRVLKTHTPLQGKTLTIIKKMVKGRQQFELV